MDDIVIADNPGAHRFELRKAGAVAAYAEYELSPDAMTLTHTEVLPQYEGQGLGSKLAKFVLDDVRRRALRVVPSCPFMAGYIRKHPDYEDLLTEKSRRNPKA